MQHATLPRRRQRRAVIGIASLLAFGLAGLSTQAETLTNDPRLEKLVNVVDVRNTGNETTGDVLNRSGQWLYRVHVLVRQHLLHADGQSDRTDLGEDTHADVIIDQPIPPGGSAQFRVPMATLAEGGASVATDVTILSVQAYAARQ
jgi:hypothetical protein